MKFSRYRLTRQYQLIIIVTLFFAAMLLVLFWFLNAKLVWFDSDGRLQQQLGTPEFERPLKQELRQSFGNLSGVVVHVMQSGCSCNWRTEAHKQVIERSVANLGGRNIKVNINRYRVLKAYIPATPAVIIFNEAEQLVYLGPYADGAFCNAESSFVDELLPQLRNRSLPGEGGWVNTVAKGCYCPVAI